MIKRIFITGLTALIPLAITIYVMIGLFGFADGFLGKPLNKFLYQYLGYKIPGLGIAIAVLIIFLLGILIHLSRIKFFRWFGNATENVLSKTPLFSKIYLPIRGIVNFLFFPPKKNFQSAVLVEYPRKGLHCLGFVTNDSSLTPKDKEGKKFYTIFIPSSPSPITGFTIIAQEEDLTFLEVSVEEAIRLVVSGGLLNPK